MSLSPLVSILVPAYKTGRLRPALESALAQEGCAEIVVADDSPGGAAKAVVDELAHAGKIRYIRNNPARGLVGNYLFLAGQARGEWLKYLDDDDVLYPGCVAALAGAVARSERASIAFSGVRFTREGEEPRDLSHDLPGLVPGAEYFLDVFPRQPITLFTRMLIRRDVMLAAAELRPPARMISLDEMAGLLACLAGDVAYVDTVTCEHAIHGAGYSGTADPGVLFEDLDYVLLPVHYAHERGLVDEGRLTAWRDRMVTKVCRANLTKLLKHGGRPAFHEHARLMNALGWGLKLNALVSWRVAVRYARSFFQSLPSRG